jgi:hypothetical protein
MKVCKVKAVKALLTFGFGESLYFNLYAIQEI